MPRMNGLELLQALQEQPRTAAIPILILTNTQFDPQTKRLCEEFPSVKAFLSKGGGVKVMREQLSRFLGS